VARACSLCVVLAVFVFAGALSAIIVGQPRNEPAGMNRPAPAFDGFSSDIANSFLENRGQVADGIRFYALGSPAVAFRDDGILFVLRESRPRERAPMESASIPTPATPTPVVAVCHHCCAKRKA